MSHFVLGDYLTPLLTCMQEHGYQTDLAELTGLTVDTYLPPRTDWNGISSDARLSVNKCWKYIWELANEPHQIATNTRETLVKPKLGNGQRADVVRFLPDHVEIFMVATLALDATSPLVTEQVPRVVAEVKAQYGDTLPVRFVYLKFGTASRGQSVQTWTVFDEAGGLAGRS